MLNQPDLQDDNSEKVSAYTVQNFFGVGWGSVHRSQEAAIHGNVEKSAESDQSGDIG